MKLLKVKKSDPRSGVLTKTSISTVQLYSSWYEKESEVSKFQ